MRLVSFRYSEFSGRPEAWEISPFELEKVNLLVGKNAAGKTRTLNAISGGAKLLSGQQPMVYVSGSYDLALEDSASDSSRIRYALSYENREVTKEEFVDGTTIRLTRRADGSGTIYEEKDGRIADFQIPKNQMAAVVRRDLIQHTYLEKLANWAKSVRHYTLGRTQSVAVSFSNEFSSDEVLNAQEEQGAVAEVVVGEKTFGTDFTQWIVAQMNEIGYPVEDFAVSELSPSPNIRIPVPVKMLMIKEKDLGFAINQAQISAGMFRALDILIHVRLAELQDRPFCLLVDDVGEGLDFDRSSKLIKILVKSALSSKIQLVMTTNDRFVMNNVPLQYWGVVHRNGSKVTVYNQRNAPLAFKEFESYGLSNFDFFSRQAFLPEK